MLVSNNGSDGYVMSIIKPESTYTYGESAFISVILPFLLFTIWPFCRHMHARTQPANTHNSIEWFLWGANTQKKNAMLFFRLKRLMISPELAMPNGALHQQQQQQQHCIKWLIEFIWKWKTVPHTISSSSSYHSTLFNEYKFWINDNINLQNIQ